MLQQRKRSEEEVAKKNYYRLAVDPTPSVLLGGKGKHVIVPSFLTIELFLTCYKLNFPHVKPVLLVMGICKGSPCLYLGPQAFPSNFQGTPIEKWVESCGVHIWQSAKVNLPQL